MTLYFSPGACSFAAHIALIEAGLKHTAEKVNLKTHTYAGGDYYAVNPKGAVPALKLDDGQLLTENVAILEYIADQNPGAGLSPRPGDFKRYRALEWLSYVSSEIHKSFGPFFTPGATPADKEKAHERVKKVFRIPAAALEKSDYLLGDRATVPDFYLYVMLTWVKHLKLELDNDQALNRFFERMQSRPSVQQAGAAESGK